jgi:hypothetical protein
MPNSTRACWTGVALAVAACGNVTDPIDELSPDAPIPADAPMVPDALVVMDRNCADVKARLGTTSDGVHRIDPDLDGVAYKPFDVFCAEMATPAPKEYLELARVSLPTDAEPVNFSMHAGGPVHNSWTCDCGPVTTLYSKVRIDPLTLIVHNFDTRFTVYSSSTQVACLDTMPGCPGPGSDSVNPSLDSTPYAVAAACITNFRGDGRANVDLTGTMFHLANDVALEPAGFTVAGEAIVSEDRKRAELTGGGDCGWLGAIGGLQLAQDF